MQLTAAQREHFDEAVAFVIKKLGCGPEVRTILDHIQELERQNFVLGRKVDELTFELFLEATNE